MNLRPIPDVAADLGLGPDDLIPYGHDKAKVKLDVLGRFPPRGRLVLVSAITPTPAGEGKTTTTIGLGQGLRRIGESVCVALREPSLGPCFGIKGGGTGGGASRLEPSTDINLHFTGDFHAIAAAHNLLSATIDNHLHFGNALGLDSRRIAWPRVIDMNDRSLREVMVGLGGRTMGIPRAGSFDITAASEVMASLCLADDADDLRARLDRLIVGFTPKGKAIQAEALGVTGAMMALLRDALLPNLVQTTEGVPALVHGGPFANIAHGCNSRVATRMAMGLADWTLTEAGFGFDLGAEKFFDIALRDTGLDTAAVVLVATIRALKHHGGADKGDLTTPDPGLVRAGLPNLLHHVSSIEAFGERPVVALNRFGDDTSAEIEVVAATLAARGVPFAVSDHFARGGEGAEDLARAVVEHAEKVSSPYKVLYSLDDTVVEKIQAVARAVYGADDVILTREAIRDVKHARHLGFDKLPICMAKTQSSLSDDASRRGRPTGFQVTVRRVLVNAGAGFLVVLTGDILRMPGLPRRPQAMDVDLVDGEITGVG